MVSEEKMFRIQPTRNKNCLWWPCYLTDLHFTGDICIFYFLVFCHHLASVVSKLFTFESSPVKPPGQMNQNLVGSICGRSSIKIANKLSNLNRGPSIGASYQVLVHLAKRFRSRFFRNWPIINKNCSAAMFVNGSNDMSNLYSTYGRSSIEIAHFVLIS
jgi:hypothetical protein